MRSGFISRALPPGVLLLVIGATPFLTGCSTLGIAQTKDVEAIQTKDSQQDGQINGIDQRVQSTETAIQQLAQQQQSYGARIDSLNANVTQMRTWLESLNVDTISQDAQQASALAMEAEQRTAAIIEHYMQRLQAELASIQAEIAAAEKMQSPAGSKGSSGGQGVDIKTTSGGSGGGN